MPATAGRLFGRVLARCSASYGTGTERVPLDPLDYAHARDLTAEEERGAFLFGEILDNHLLVGRQRSCAAHQVVHLHLKPRAAGPPTTTLSCSCVTEARLIDSPTGPLREQSAAGSPKMMAVAWAGVVG